MIIPSEFQSSSACESVSSSSILNPRCDDQKGHTDICSLKAEWEGAGN